MVQGEPRQRRGGLQQLRDLRELRFQHDSDVTRERIDIVVMDTGSTETFGYLPPGNEVLAQHSGAELCEALDLGTKRFTVLSPRGIPDSPGLLSYIDIYP